MTTTEPTPSERPTLPTRYTRFPSLIALAVLHVGCDVFAGKNPCDPETGEAGWIFYHDGEYVDLEGRPYAVPGDRPFDACKVIRGNISLRGPITDFSDFDHVESIPGFYENGSILDDAPAGGAACGAIRGFPSLRRITWEVRDSNGSEDVVTGCYYLDGFESLEFVGRDFVCRGPEHLGSELREVGGTLTCPEDRLQKLERVGSLRYKGGTLPNLRWAGQISTWENTASPNPLEKIDLPLLEEVGPYFLPGHPSTNVAGLAISGGTIRSIAMPLLRRVNGPFGIAGTGIFHDDIYVEGRAEALRTEFYNVEQTSGQRIFCLNDPTDPCPNEDACEVIYGEGSLECCSHPWLTCLELYGQRELP